MAGIEFLQIEVVLAIHVNQTTHYGGDASIRDLRLLESAISQPQTSFGENYLHAFPFKWLPRICSTSS